MPAHARQRYATGFDHAIMGSVEGQPRHHEHQHCCRCDYCRGYDAGVWALHQGYVQIEEVGNESPPMAATPAGL